MQKAILFLFILTVGFATNAQTYLLTVTNGYGSGNYAAGDTVDVWSAAIPLSAVFDQWTGDVATMQSRDEWHTTLVMPAQNTTIAANFKTIGNISINYEKIMGRDTLKNVYSYFPANFKGVIFCFHGTGGAASNWTNSLEYRQFLNDAIADTFAFIVTEAEEITKQTDFDMNGKLRWSTLPFDTISNVDFANIRAIRDTFFLRGITHSSTRYYAVGMSNGGNFSPAIATALGWQAAVSYCAQASQLLMNTTTVPVQWCMAQYDNNENVGAQGNADALADHNTLLSRGICSKYFLHDRSPVYPERFMRSGTISQNSANSLFAEFQTNQLLNANNYLLFASDSIAAKIAANPTAYPVFLSFNGLQRAFIAGQVDAMFAAHQFFSDFNKRTLRFFNSFCDTVATPSGVVDVTENGVSVYPNPCSHQLNVHSQDSEASWFSLYNFLGQEVYQQPCTQTITINTTALPGGIYFYALRNRSGSVKTGKVIKQ